ncbi:low molecular weight phosphatase family protein [Agreia sp. COWG]|uniref:arsenate reductase/protein-tyrosine-phosphatase family protein n=1 Tax=Agreia sp. COWG TaxID=2773266 RepID=UPI001926F1EB|nr:low molecular weight phosphatase family protein [Agreia sp. COWG]
MSKPDVDTDVFVVLFVCTGNICRSPLAEHIFRSQISSISDVVYTHSAGTHALVGRPMTAEAAALSVALGADPSRHTAADLTLPMVQRADLILVASREHRSATVSMMPRASRKTFTIREFERLLGTHAERVPESVVIPGDRSREALTNFVADVASMRGLSRNVPSPGDDDIVDPYRQPQDVYDKAASLILSAITATSRSLERVANTVVTDKRDDALRQ